MTRRWIAAALALTLVALPGCKTMGRQVMANPVVEVKNVVVKGIGTQGGALDVILDVYNPNEFRMDATRISYQFWVDSSQVMNGEISKLVTLAQKGRTEIVVPVNFTYSEVSKLVNTFMLRGVVDYRVTGQFTVVTPFGNITRPYSGAGRLNSMP